MRGGVFLLESATHTTRIPTHTTIMVALTGTMILRSIQSGKPGKLDLVSASLIFPPNGGARVPSIEKHTFSDGIIAAFDDTDNNDGNDDDCKSSDNGDDEVEVGEEGHDLGLEVPDPGENVIVWKFSCWGEGPCKQTGADGISL